MTKSEMSVVWLRDIPGLNSLGNSVCCAVDSDRAQDRIAVLFPGDVMDREAVMPPDRRRFSFERTATAILMQDRSIGAVVLVQAAKRLGETACFTNFVPSGTANNDDDNKDQSSPYSPDGHATEHLYHLMHNVSKRLCMDQIPRLVLAGFSRGGVVINQVITELHRGKHADLWSKVDEIRWIDTGNSPGVGAFPLDRIAITAFAEMARNQPIRVVIAGSPFQWKNYFRPNTVIERRDFIETLRSYMTQSQLSVRYYFADRAPSLDDHFAMLIEHLHPENGIDITEGA